MEDNLFTKILRIMLNNLTHLALNIFTFQLFHDDERLWVFAVRSSGLGLISFMRLDGRTDDQSVKSVQ